MKTAIITLACAASLIACTRMDQYYPGAKVATVDGSEHLVRQLNGRQNTYQAMENRPTMGQMMTGIDAAIYGRNVRAIEMTTGCKVDVATISNSGNQTIAATAC